MAIHHAILVRNIYIILMMLFCRNFDLAIKLSGEKKGIL